MARKNAVCYFTSIRSIRVGSSAGFRVQLCQIFVGDRKHPTCSCRRVIDGTDNTGLRQHVVVLNKQDLAPTANLSKIDIYPVLKTSALTGTGLSELRRAILSLLTRETTATETALITNLRQQRAVSAALAALSRIQQAAAIIPHEIILVDLYEALQALDALTGTTTSDDILNLIFSKFCIGK